MARPTWGNWGSGNWAGNWGNHQDNSGDDSNNAVATEVAVVTAYTTVTYGGNWGQPTPAPTAEATHSHNFPSVPDAPSPAPAESSSAPESSGSTGTYMDIVEKWRGKLGMSSLTEDNTLQGNSLKTVQDGNGQMVHELNPGSMAQVLAPGAADEFEKVFVGGWLCERADLPGLDGICATMSQGWEYNGETGHADILTSKAYSKIGCALADGIWGCDLA